MIYLPFHFTFVWLVLLIFSPITYYCYLHLFYFYCLRKIKTTDKNRYQYINRLQEYISVHLARYNLLLRTEHNILKCKWKFRQILLLMLDFHHRMFVSLIILFSCLKFYNTKIQKIVPGNYFVVLGARLWTEGWFEVSADCIQNIKQQRSIETNITIGHRDSYQCILHGIIFLLGK